MRRINRNREYEMVSVALHDHKRFDRFLPRIRRTAENLGPCDVVFLDVKNCDVRIPRKDGGKVAAALITFYDVATRRAFSCLGQLRRGDAGPGAPVQKAATQAMISDALAALLRAPEWGLPRVLYTDNGKEMAGLPTALARLAEGTRCQVIFAAPNTPQAKPVEGFFSTLNRTVFRQLPGFNGGKAGHIRNSPSDRSNSDIVPHWDEYGRQLQDLMADYHDRKGRDGKSPNEHYHAKSETFGFKPRIVSEFEIAKLFGEHFERQNKQASIMINGDRFYHDYLTSIMPGKLDTLETPTSDVVCAPEQPSATDHSVLVAAERAVIKLSRDKQYNYLDPENWTASEGFDEAERRKNLMLGAALRRLVRFSEAHPSAVLASLRGLRAQAHARRYPKAEAGPAKSHTVVEHDHASPPPEREVAIPLADSFEINDL